MKKIILILTLIASMQLTNAFVWHSKNRCYSPFSNFGSWPYYSFDYYDRAFCPKAYDDYYS